MKFIRETAPYIRKQASVKRMMLDVIIALLPVVLFAIIQNGWNGVYVILLSIVIMLAGEIICHMLTHWPKDMKFKELFSKDGFKKIKSTYTINNITAPLISAIIYSMIMPAGAPAYVVIVGALFGILVGKMAFGGLGNNIFNPAAVGRIFVLICFGSKINNATANGVIDVAAGGTPLAQLGESLKNFNYAIANYPLKDLFLGNIPGMMGEVSALCILIGAIYLFARRSADLRCALSMILSFTIIMLTVGIMGYVKKTWDNPFEFVSYELLSGGLLFGATFMITDPVTGPVNKVGRIAYGTLAGIITALVRLLGAYPEGVAFSILICNMFAPMIDHLTIKNAKYNWRQALIYVLVMCVMCLVVAFSVKGAL